MAEPDVVEFGPPPAHRRRWRWAAALSVLAVTAMAAVYSGWAHRETVQPSTAAAHGSPPQLAVYGYRFIAGGDQQSFSLSLRNVGSAETYLSAAVVSPTPGVTIVSIGFTADKDPTSVTSPALVVPTQGTAQLVVQYTVDCAAVRSPWPYLGDIWVQLTNASASQRSQLQPGQMPPAGQPSPLPCAAPSSFPSLSR